jgi:predicted nucleic acid-binding protein
MYLLDTNVIIDFFNAKLPEKAKKILLDNDPLISVITRIELFATTKITEIEKSKLESFIAYAKIFDSINETIVSSTIYIRQNYRLKLPDAIIAATAITYDLTLLTRNNADFNKIEGLKLLDPYNL